MLFQTALVSATLAASVIAAPIATTQSGTLEARAPLPPGTLSKLRLPLTAAKFRPTTLGRKPSVLSGTTQRLQAAPLKPELPAVPPLAAAKNSLQVPAIPPLAPLKNSLPNPALGQGIQAPLGTAGDTLAPKKPGVLEAVKVNSAAKVETAKTSVVGAATAVKSTAAEGAAKVETAREGVVNAAATAKTSVVNTVDGAKTSVANGVANVQAVNAKIGNGIAATKETVSAGAARVVEAKDSAVATAQNVRTSVSNGVANVQAVNAKIGNGIAATKETVSAGAASVVAAKDRAVNTAQNVKADVQAFNGRVAQGAANVNTAVKTGISNTGNFVGTLASQVAAAGPLVPPAAPLTDPSLGAPLTGTDPNLDPTLGAGVVNPSLPVGSVPGVQGVQGVQASAVASTSQTASLNAVI